MATKNSKSFPDVLFLDINMPIRTGWDFLVKYDSLLKEGVVKPLKIYMLSSSVYQEDMIKANEDPLVTRYIFKPLNKIILQELS